MVFSRASARSIFSRTTVNGFAFDAEAVFLAHRQHLRIRKVPVTLINEYASTISLTRNAIPMLMDVLRVRWNALLGMYDVPMLEPESDNQPQTPNRAAA
jgi:hypothetical protein